MNKTAVILEFNTKQPLTPEEVQRLHCWIHSQMTLNIQRGAEFIDGAEWQILGEDRKPVVVFDRIGRAYLPSSE